jgi:hypothetical protein
MPGGMITLSCDGNTPGTGIVWTLAPLNGEEQFSDARGVTRYYATNFVSNPNGGKTLKLLWHSDQSNIVYNHDRLNPPVVAMAEHVYRLTAARSTCSPDTEGAIDV